jgi:hypothetical protein
VGRFLGKCQVGRDGRNRTRNRRTGSEKRKDNVNICCRDVDCEAGMPIEEPGYHIQQQNFVLVVLNFKVLFLWC